MSRTYDTPLRHLQYLHLNVITADTQHPHLITLLHKLTASIKLSVGTKWNMDKILLGFVNEEVGDRLWPNKTCNR